MRLTLLALRNTMERRMRSLLGSRRRMPRKQRNLIAVKTMTPKILRKQINLIAFKTITPKTLRNTEDTEEREEGGRCRPPGLWRLSLEEALGQEKQCQHTMKLKLIAMKPSNLRNIKERGRSGQ